VSYYLRVLGLENKSLNYKEILNSSKLIGNVSIDNQDMDNWKSISIRNKKGKDVAIVEKNIVEIDSLGQDEIDEFLEEILDYKPDSAVKWLTDYLRRIKVIYAINVLDAAYIDDNWDIISSLQQIIWNHTGGILQADNEGFSNEDGFHILWQFDENVTGDWNMAILNENGTWENFTMDLGNSEHRKHFKKGKKITK
jgi:hypothetical protein